MARIRSIKPEMRTDLTVAEWPREVRYAWVLLLGYLDDYGRGRDDSRLVVADLFPLDRDVTERKINTWLDRMAKSGPLCRYNVDGQGYLHAVKWSNHQRISHPTESRLPPCPVHDLHEPIPNGTGTDPEPRQNDSGETPEPLRPSRAPAEQGAGSREQGNKGAGNARGARIPTGWLPDADLVAWHRGQGIPDAFARATLDDFRDYWTAKTGANATKADWPATWRRWLRKAWDERPPGDRASRSQRETDDLFERAAQRMGVTQ
jgi:hypothetical protein